MLNVTELIDAHLNLPSTYGVGDPDELFHPSSAGYCVRQMARSKKRLSRFSTPILGAMKVGTILHGFIQGNILDGFPVEIEKQVETPVFGEIFFRGKIDIVFKGVPYDIKTYGAKYFPKEPKIEHITQLNMYMGTIGAEEGYLIYVLKNNLRSKMFRVPFNQEMFMATIFKANTVYQKLKEWKKGDKFPFDKCDCYYCANEM